MRKLLYLLIAIVAIAAVVWFYSPGLFTKMTTKTTEETKPTVNTSAPEATLGGTIYKEVSNNPAAAIPQTNPFAQEINPIKSAYKNPFGNQ
jgi:hypothetical protein